MMRTLTLPSRLARTSCSMLALATVLAIGATPAMAQSFQGTGSITSGSGSITTGVNTTNITVSTPQTVIDWTPFDTATSPNTIAFQNSGTTASFAGSGNFAVLNRINPADSTRSITMNGLIQAISAGAGPANGSIYFYSPGGFVLGASSVINVGSLVLSASPINVTGGNFINGTSNTVVFDQAPNALAAIVTNVGSQINATTTGAYVAMVAPRLVHGGSINVSGSAALVGAEAATINFSPDGLFDIQVTAGTGDSQGIVVNGGSITGSASTGASDIHRAYLVAVPKNNALTMLLTAGTSLGFAIAGAADVVGNTVVLSAGYDVVDGTIETTRSAGGGTGLSDMTVYDTDFTSQVNAAATDLGLFVASTTTASMAAGLTLRAANAQFNALNNGIHQVAGSVTLDTSNLGTGTGATGGTAYSVAWAGGTINIGGNLTLNSRGVGSAGVSGTGGSTYVQADTGASMNVSGILRMNADGSGGTGATGRGGTIDVIAGPGASLTAGSLNAGADGYGGDDAGAGAGNGTGGSARLLATGTGASLAIANVVTVGTLNQRDFVSVEGYGGQANGGGSGIGGTGQGGNLLIRGEGGGALALPNIADPIGVRILARGYGGDAAASATAAGLGAAGTLNIQLDNATLTAGPVLLSSAGIGGNAIGTGNINGGAGIGGTRAISVINGSTLSIGLPGGVAGGSGGTGSGTGTGGNASGGNASLTVDASTVNFTSRSIIVVQNLAGDGAAGGNASGGNATITVRNGGIVNVPNDPLASDGLAIGSYAYGGNGTSGQGGSANAGNSSLQLQGGTINLSGNMTLGAAAFGGDSSGSGNGGNATGGTVNAFATGTNNAIAGAGTATFSTNAYGGFSTTGTGGNATAGSTNVGTNSGATLAIASPLILTASGFGGGGGTAGGGGFGGTAQIFGASTSSLTIGGVVQIEANGVGGGDGESNGNGGLGDGGLAAVTTAGGAITFNNNVAVSASATGGSSGSGLGGAALGGTARLAANGGSILVTGDLSVTGSATGGSGSTGGNATALVSPVTDEGSPVAAAVTASSGGSVRVNGQTTMDGRATGGTGFNGNGGTAIAGEADVVASIGTVNLNSLALDVSALGGNGGNGGTGGSGVGGAADLAFGLNSAPINGTITLGTAAINASGIGGTGGAGSGGIVGGAGGAGGAGSGGVISFYGSAAGGTLNSGDAILTALGTGGRGGAGGIGTTGTGGAGGVGGAGAGGRVQTGTISQSASPNSGGGANLADLSANTSATGGNGGNGGSGGGGNGGGGNGGAAAGGSSSFLIRGVPATADVVTLTANATGGNGGSGATTGNGGNARTGFTSVESKDRFEVPAQRGTLIANAIVANAIAVGGSGATAGTSTLVNGSYFRVFNGDATIGSVAITLSGTFNDSTFGPSFVSVRDGIATIGSFSFITTGTLALDADNGTMNANSIALSAANFVPHVLDPAPVVRGTYFADSATITTGNNFVTNANLDIGGDLSIVTPGLIIAQQFTTDGNLDLWAQGGGITATNLDVAGGADLSASGSILIGSTLADSFYADAGGSFTSGNITSDSNIEIYAGTDMTLGNLLAGLNVLPGSDEAVGLEAGGSIVMGNVTALEGIDFSAGGSVTGGNLTSGLFVGGEAEGAVSLGVLSAGLVSPQGVPDQGFSVGITSATSVTTGNVAGAYAVGFATLGPITTGTVNAGTDFLVMASGNMAFGPITAGGRVYLADSSMFIAAGGGGDGETEDFDPELVFSALPVASGGSISLNGAISAGSLQAATETSLTIIGDISIDSSIALSSGGAMLIDSVDAGGSIALRSDSSVTGDNLTAGSSVSVDANGAITLGNILAGTGIGTADVGPGSPVEIFTHGSIVTGNITTDGYVGLYAEVDVATGTINAGHDVIALVGDDASFGAITTPERFFLAGYGMIALVGGGESFNPEGVFNVEDPIATGGSATFAGSSSATTFEAYVGDNTTLASLDTEFFATIDTGGLFTLSGALNGYSEIISNDIAIGNGASVNNGYLSLTSRNPSQTLIGDGLDSLGQGYRLSDAEADRIRTGFSIVADTSYGAAAKMVVGDLSITAPGASENDNEYEFETINRDSDDSSVGSIKVVGDVVFTGLGEFDEVSFDTNLFQLDAATGSISLFSQGTTLGGELGLYAPRIWVASADILAKLEVNPTYSGYIAELNAPAAVQRPEGVIRAASIDIDTDGDEGARSFLVQNTGTKETPAGLVINDPDPDDGDDGDEIVPGSIDLVINGQIITQTGTLTGIAVRDRLVLSEIDTTEFTAGSTINGCPLVGACTAPPPRKIDTPTSSDVQLSDSGGLGDGMFGNEGEIAGESGDGEGDGDSKSSPIAPPNPLFDSRPLTQSADVDDPVSGAGNPSLYGDTADQDAKDEDAKDEGCDASKGNNCQTGKKGDGK